MPEDAKTITDALPSEPATATPASAEARNGQTVTAPVDEKKAPVQTTTAPVTFSQSDLDARIASVKGGYEGTISKMRADTDALKKQLADLQTQAAENSLANQLAQLVDAGVPEDTGKRFVAAQRDLQMRLATLAQREAEITEQMEVLNAAGRERAASDWAREYGLDDKAKGELLKAPDLASMEREALKMAVAKQRTEAVPAETPPKPAPGAGGIDVNKLNPITRLGLAAEGKI